MIKKRIVVVGASRGIGKYIADSLTEAGFTVWRVSRSTSLPCNYTADVTNAPQMLECADCVDKAWGYADGLIYCAGIHGEIGPCLQMHPADWNKVMETNVSGFFYTMLAFSDLLDGSPYRPKVMAFAGGGAVKARPNFSAYATSKAALVRLIEGLSEEKGFMDVNAIAPGAILTDMTKEIVSAGEKKAGADEYAQAARLTDNPEKLAKVLKCVRFLLSEESDGISGRLIPANEPDLRKVNWSDKNMFRLRHIDGR